MQSLIWSASLSVWMMIVTEGQPWLREYGTRSESVLFLHEDACPSVADISDLRLYFRIKRNFAMAGVNRDVPLNLRELLFQSLRREMTTVEGQLLVVVRK